MIQTIKHFGYKEAFIDLLIYIAIMFLVRELSIPNADFIFTGLLYSLTTFAVATWRMRARGITWKDIGFRKPKNITKTILKGGIVFVCVIIVMSIFYLVTDSMFPSSNENAVDTRFSKLKGNYTYFFSIIFFVWVESALEELLDRAFLITWFERLFSNIPYATILAVIAQAAIFGFRHSYDISERSISVALIGLVMGIAYIKFNRNLWPIIIAHAILNTMSMLERI